MSTMRERVEAAISLDSAAGHEQVSAVPERRTAGIGEPMRGAGEEQQRFMEQDNPPTAVPLGVPPQAHLSPVVALILSQKARANGYRSLMEGTFPYADKLEMKARAAWCRFRVSCERFNRGLPGSWSPYEPDSWRPLIQVMPEATRYSRHAMKRVQEETLDLPPELVERERYEAQKMGYAEQVRFLKWYGEQKKP